MPDADLRPFRRRRGRANVDADLSGVDFGDIMTFTVVIENKGGSGAFDIVIHDVLPAGLGMPAGTAAA